MPLPGQHFEARYHDRPHTMGPGRRKGRCATRLRAWISRSLPGLKYPFQIRARSTLSNLLFDDGATHQPAHGQDTVMQDNTDVSTTSTRWTNADTLCLFQCTVRHREMKTDISEASKRVSIFSFATQGGKQVSFYFRQGNWVQAREAQIRFPAG